MAEVTNQLNHKTRELEGKEQEESKKYKKNLDKLKRLMEENSVLLANLEKNTQKIKELETKLQTMPPTTSEELESSTKGKRDHTDLSPAQEELLRPSKKHARHV